MGRRGGSFGVRRCCAHSFRPPSLGRQPCNRGRAKRDNLSAAAQSGHGATGGAFVAEDTALAEAVDMDVDSLAPHVEMMEPAQVQA